MSPLNWPSPLRLITLVIFFVAVAGAWNLMTTGAAQDEVELRYRWQLELQDFQFQVRARVVREQLQAEIVRLEGELAASSRSGRRAEASEPVAEEPTDAPSWEALKLQRARLLQELERSGISSLSTPARQVRQSLEQLSKMEDGGDSAMAASSGLVPTLNDLMTSLRESTSASRENLQRRYQGLLAMFAVMLSLLVVALLLALYYHRQQRQWEARHQSALQTQGDLRADMVAQERQMERIRKPFEEMTAELQTPVTQIKAVSGYLMDRAIEADEKAQLESVWRVTRSLMNTVEQADDFFRMTSGHFLAEQLFFDLDVSIEGVVSRMAPQAREKGLKLILRHSPLVPKQLPGDPSRLIQVLSILIERAIRATPRGWVLVEVERHDKDNLVSITIEDTGRPIPEAELEKVFDGLKLGLAYGLIEKMGGALSVISERGRGSTFTIEFPSDKHTSAEPAPEFLEGSRMLIVDDDPVNRDILQELLTAWGVGVRACTSGESAMSALETSILQGRPYHILLIDETVADGSGQDLCRLIRADPRYLQVALIYLSELEQGTEILDIGFDDALTKPLLPSRLSKCLHRIGAPDNEVTDNSWLQGIVRVLLVDPRGGRRILAAAAIERLGCRVDEARSAEDVEALLQQLPYVIVFVGGSQVGRRALEIVKRHAPKMPVVAMVRSRGDEGRFLEAGADSCIRGMVDTQAILSSFRQHQIGLDRYLDP